MYLCYYSINLILQFLSLAFSIAVIITLYPTGKYCPLDVPKTLSSVVPRTSSKYTIWPSQGRPHLIFRRISQDVPRKILKGRYKDDGASESYLPIHYFVIQAASPKT